MRPLHKIFDCHTPHHFFAPVERLCETWINALYWPLQKSYFTFYFILYILSVFTSLKTSFFDQLSLFPTCACIFKLLHLLTMIRLLFFKLVRGGCVGTSYNSQVKWPAVSCLGRRSSALLKNPLLKESCPSVLDGGDTVSVVASCFPP